MRIQRFRRLVPFVLDPRPLYRCVTSLMLLALIVMGLPALADAQPTCLPDGDVDQNGSVTAADALLVFQQALGLADLNACQRSIADVFPQPTSPDGAITASDALCIFQKALILPSCLDTLPSSNLPPVVDAGPDQSIEGGVMVFMTGTGSDPDGIIAAYAWTQTGGAAVSLTGFDAATAVLIAPDVSVEETLTFRLTVTDDAGAQASDEVTVTVRPAMGPVDEPSAAEVFSQHISGPIVQTKCVTCHVQGGASGNTRLVFVRATDSPDHEALNLQTFQNFLAAVADEGGGSYVLNRIQGVGHGGGVQVSPGTEEFVNMQRFLGLLGEEVAPAPVTVETLFDTVVLASPRKTLRRAALIFAGRIPTDAEYAAVESGDESVLRAAIRGLMEGPQFHEFLIRASNDRLLTDREHGVIDEVGFFVDFVNEHYRRKKSAHESGDERAWDDFHAWYDRVQYGARRAPLELIAYVAENDLPYTEILTADYIMANAWAAAAYGASTHFGNPDDPYEFKPSRIVSYYRQGEGYKDEDDRVVGAVRVIDPGPLITDYPHAGILNTNAFLLRYPSTATNRNRARARWTYYHFLGLDVEKSASRTTDPVALADTNNPTMHNPNCTVCHSVLDPVAGAFQNYGDDGLYLDQWGGMDSLDQFYKYPERSDDFGDEGVVTVEASSYRERETVSTTVRLWQNGMLFVRFANDYNDRSTGVDRNVHIDRLVVREEEDGNPIHEIELEDLTEQDLGDGDCGLATQDTHFTFYSGCRLRFALDIPIDSTYHVEAVVWADQAGEELAKLIFGSVLYEEGDTWYRDMRTPGFDGAEAPHPDNSLQWLARRIVADDRFAEAAVQFWWPAIMGSEIAEFPAEAADANFEGLLLAANAQDAEMVRLADGFRRGFQGNPYAYNLKDLLTEIVLSKWFRADASTDTNPVRRVALHDAGVRRLLTPEELARKTAAITGVQWERRISRGPRDGRWPSALAGPYRLLYGGIDSDGVTERARDITSVMAGVAKRHAVQVSCPVVMREFYLLPDTGRRLFAGIDPSVTPTSEFGASFRVEAESWDERETFSLSGALTAGAKSVRLSFIKNMDGQKLRLDRLEVRNAAGEVVARREIKDVEWSGGDCGQARSDNFSLYCDGSSVSAHVDIPAEGNYVIEVTAWGDQTGAELPELGVAVESNSEGSAGSAAIRNKLVELHDKLFGVRVTPDSPEVQAAYRLFVDVWTRGREAQDDRLEFWQCNVYGRDHFYFEGILDNTIVEYENERGHRYYHFDWDRIEDFLHSIDPHPFSDPQYAAQTWVVVLAAMMMDYRYLYL